MSKAESRFHRFPQILPRWRASVNHFSWQSLRLSFIWSSSHSSFITGPASVHSSLIIFQVYSQSLFAKGLFCGEDSTMLTLKESKNLCKLKWPSDSHVFVWKTLTWMYVLTWNFEANCDLLSPFKFIPQPWEDLTGCCGVAKSPSCIRLIDYVPQKCSVCLCSLFVPHWEQVFPSNCFSYHFTLNHLAYGAAWWCSD